MRLPISILASLFCFVQAITVSAQENAPTDADVQMLLAYSQELVDIAQEHSGNCVQMREALGSSYERHQEALNKLVYSTSRATDADTALIVQRAETLGKLTAACYQEAPMQEMLKAWSQKQTP